MRKRIIMLCLSILVLMPAAMPLFAADVSEAERHCQAARELANTDPQKAEAEFKAAIAADDKYIPAYLDLARLLISGNRVADALTYVDQAIKLDPKNAEAYFIRGYCYLALNTKSTLDNAVASFRQALAIKPDSVPYHRLLALAYGRLDQGQEALGEYVKIIKLAPNDAGMRFEYGLALLNAGRLPESATQLEKAVALDKANYQYHWSLGTVYRHQGRYDEAIEQMQTAMNLQPKSAALLCDLGLIYAGKKDLKTAMEWYKKAVDLDPKLASGWYNLACAYALQNDTDNALANLEKAFNLFPDLRKVAANDFDLDSLRGNARFKSLMNG